MAAALGWSGRALSTCSRRAAPARQRSSARSTRARSYRASGRSGCRARAASNASCARPCSPRRNQARPWSRWSFTPGTPRSTVTRRSRAKGRASSGSPTAQTRPSRARRARTTRPAPAGMASTGRSGSRYRAATKNGRIESAQNRAQQEAGASLRRGPRARPIPASASRAGNDRGASRRDAERRCSASISLLCGTSRAPSRRPALTAVRPRTPTGSAAMLDRARPRSTRSAPA